MFHVKHFAIPPNIGMKLCRFHDRDEGLGIQRRSDRHQSHLMLPIQLTRDVVEPAYARVRRFGL